MNTERSPAVTASPFKYRGRRDDELYSWEEYVAIFELPNDGCPHSQQALEIVAKIYDDQEQQITAFVISANGEKRRRLGDMDVACQTAMAVLLYPAVRKVTRTILEPT